jgi:hypothetical protein
MINPAKPTPSAASGTSRTRTDRMVVAAGLVDRCARR